MEQQTCFFIGHRDAPDELFTAISDAVGRCVLAGVTRFVVGGYGNFDRLAARCSLAEEGVSAGAAFSAASIPAYGASDG